MKNVLITCTPFGDIDDTPLRELRSAGANVDIEPLGRALSEDDLFEIIPAYDAVIAGTEPLSAKVLGRATRLKHISRIGIGLDSVDLTAAKEYGIAVSYTPDAPAPAVAELTIGLMLSLCRSIHTSDHAMHHNIWLRRFGYRIQELTLGIIGVGRIGKRVIEIAHAFSPRKILCNDLKEQREFAADKNLVWATKEDIYREADIISLHVPLTKATINMIAKEHLAMMKPTAFLLNTARGKIVNDTDLYLALKDQRIGGAAIDVFNNEPYTGPLCKLDNCLLTSHMGSMSFDCRARMEIEAARETTRFLAGEPLQSIVPEFEYLNQARS